MSKGKQNPPANNHYLPQGYQRFFADRTNTKRQPWVGEIAYGKWKNVQRSTRAVGFARNLYTPEVEQSFKVVEDNAYAAMRACIENRPLKDLELPFLAAFILTMRFRGPGGIQRLREMVLARCSPGVPGYIVEDLVQKTLIGFVTSESVLGLCALGRTVYKFDADKTGGIWTTDRPVIINPGDVVGTAAKAHFRLVSMALDYETVLVFHDGSLPAEKRQEYAENHNRRLLLVKPNYLFTHRKIENGTFLNDVAILRHGLTDKGGRG